jgi:hypothetical protein
MPFSVVMATRIESMCLEMAWKSLSVTYITVVFLLLAELLFKEVQAKVNQPDRIALSSTQV